MKFLAEKKIYYTLRIASAMCFIGHGSFGIITKSIWSNYFGVFGISPGTSYHLMPIVGSIDVLMGIIILVYPMRAIITWLVIWGAVTALLRPLSGEPFAEFIERSGNFGAPLALIILSGYAGDTLKKMLSPVKPAALVDTKLLRAVTTCLRFVVCFLFVGHGWLNIIDKKDLVDLYMRLGFVNPVKTAGFIGIFEIVAGLWVLIRPIRSFVLLLFVWKIISELFYPHYEIFEWIERGGSYGAILALWFALGIPSSVAKKDLVGKSGSRWLNYNRARINFSLPVYKMLFK
ncbi:hypothetical protein FW778_15635 [Ginsengibacter hankyongi]|uniref:DoxX family protein n=1 Tax=Ginsengibacter hankyongi TaxID=2607284 RepID=A0A5J5IGH8_9BACT|nr:hypothetical protein [Ginsengibacter hankyongi]KAA9038180.1 hypothetical protein FW778_15635 [Ginsengibacter hankyongi]